MAGHYTGRNDICIVNAKEVTYFPEFSKMIKYPQTED
jgi:hypothetical protein